MKALGPFLQRYGILVAFLVLFLIAGLYKPDIFLKPENIRNLLNQNAEVGIIAIGMTLVIVTAGIDLTVGSLFALCAVVGLNVLNRVMAAQQSEMTAVWVACFTCVGMGVILGMWNGLLVAFGRITPFVATLVGLVGFRSICLATAEGGEVRSSSMNLFPNLGSGGIPIPFLTVGNNQPLKLTWGILAFVACALIAGWVLNNTRLGRYAIAIGANERAARYSGIPVNAVKFWIYTLMGAFCGIAAILSSAKLNSVSSGSSGTFYELDAIAAVVVGGSALNGGQARIWGTVVGVLFLGLITNLLIIAGVSEYYKGLVKAIIILVAVLLQRTQSQN